MKNSEHISRGQIPTYLVKMHEGDLDARNKLIEHYTNNIINHIETHYNNVNCPKEDLIQSAILAIVKVLDRYKTDDITFFNVKLHYHLNAEIQKQIKLFENNITEEKMNIEFDLNDIESIDLIKRALKKLPERNQKIIYLYFFKEYTFRKIAEILNLDNHQYIHQLLNESLNFIKQDVLFNSIDSENYSNVLNKLNNYSKDILLNDQLKISLFNKYISLQNEKNTKVLYLYFYNNLSFEKLATLFNTKNEKIELIIKKFIIFFKTESYKRNELNKLLGIKYNSALNRLYDELENYSEVEIKTALKQVLINDKILLDRFINCKDIKTEENLRNIIIEKIKKYIREKNKKIVKTKN